jgi:hypothetical protein
VVSHDDYSSIVGIFSSLKKCEPIRQNMTRKPNNAKKFFNKSNISFS